MNKYAVVSGIALIVAAMLTDVAVADPLEEITVLATNHVDRSSTGIPIEEISLSVSVNADGLDLATRAGLNAMEKRVRDAATSACSEIGSRYPFAEPSNAECAIAAAREPLAEVREAAKQARQSA